MAIQLNDDHLKARVFLRPQVKQVDIVLVGCGGTGSWLVQDLCRIAYGESRMAVSLTLVDPDHVEEKNVIRQNFAPAEMGRNKAKALAERYASAYGLPIRAVPKAFAQNQIDPYRRSTFTILIGCVDNAAARQMLAKTLDGHADSMVWLDCGNHTVSGQVVLGNALTVENLSGAFKFNGRCTRLPCTFLLYPNLKKALPEEKRQAVKKMSCEDIVAANFQALMVNRQVATIAATFVAELLANTLKRFKTTFDLQTMTMQSSYIVPERVAGQIAHAMGKTGYGVEVFKQGKDK